MCNLINIHTYIHTCVSFVDHQIFLRSFVSGLGPWTVVSLVFALEKYLGAVGRPDIARGDHTHLACLLLPRVIFHYSSSTFR